MNRKIIASVCTFIIAVSCASCEGDTPAEVPVLTTAATSGTTAQTTAETTAETSTTAAETTTTAEETAAETTTTTTETAAETTTTAEETAAETTSAATAETTAVTTALTKSATAAETTTETTATTTTAETTAQTTTAAAAETTAAATSETTTAATAGTTAGITTVETAAAEEYIYRLSNPNASADAQRTYNYLCESFGKVMLSCQQESTWMGSPDYEMNYILETTGKLPAMRGLDFMNNDFAGVVQRSKEWHAKGGIVTICWHTGVNGSGYQESLNDNPDYSKLLTKGTSEYNAMIASWDRAAAALAELRDAGVTVLWRPFHEFDGQWFWWGKGGSENFIKLWRMMYEYFTDEKGLDNLIWVLGYCGDVKNGWYPGDEYCDIIGSDTYDNSTNRKAWNRLVRLNTGKPLAFHECGNLPRIEKFDEDGDLWSWFMVWHTEHITGNNKKNLSLVYNSEKVITLDELPEL